MCPEASQPWEPDPPGQAERAGPRRRLERLLLCALIFSVLVVWLLLWPYTGDGDSVLHYLNLRDAAADPTNALSPWARPVFVLLMVVPAMGGVVAVRCFAAALSTILVWQTMRLADDLKLPNSTLAGLLVLWQPLAFYLASDTMTEMPTALGIVLAIRLWWARRVIASCVLVSFLPMVRPEGFFLAPMWAVMVLGSQWLGPLWRRLRLCLPLGTGMLCWVLACLIFTGDPIWFVTVWSWPFGGFPGYFSGPLFHHVLLWPYYCGPVLIVLFVAGVWPSLRRQMALPWAVWGMVFGVHSILFWRGWFSALGVMRIQCTTAAVTALICLYGWNSIGRWLSRRGAGATLKRAVAAAAMLLATAAPIFYYLTDAERHRSHLVRDVARHVRANRLLAGAPRIFTGEHIVLAELNLTSLSPRVMENAWDRRKQLNKLAALPVGSVGVWDNQRAEDWYDVAIEDILQLGYEALYETGKRVRAWHCGDIPLWPRTVQLRYVVLRKTAPATVPAGLLAKPWPP